ncbi:Pycsar system effector family protein [Streptomyces sp. NPDC054863]
MVSRAETEASIVRNEMQSANTQASVMLAVVAITASAFAGQAEGLFRHSWITTTLATLGIVVASGAVWLLLDVVLPRLDASGRGSFQTWAEYNRDQLHDALTADFQLDELRVLSRIALAKYRRLRWAGYLLRLSFLFLAAASTLALL